MNYEFSLDKKSLALLLGGLSVLGLLLFAAGLLVGVRLNANPPELAQNAAPPTAATPAGAPPNPGPEPVKLREEPETDDVNEARVKPAAAPPVVASANLPQAASAKESTPAPPAATTASKPETPPVASAAPAARPSQTNYSVSLAADAIAGERPPVRQTFAVQVGAFRQEANAQRLLEQLESKGYSVAVFQSSDIADNVWYAVRLGPYTTQNDARRAAANIAQQENLKAIVRPTRSL